MKTVLHLTAHLGGGVGKALSGLACQAASAGSPFSHQFVILEPQEKPQFLNRIVEAGCEVVVCPDKAQLRSLIEAADIVQLEWWNHPATLRALCSEELPPMRLLVWSHVSGLNTPIIPAGLMRVADRFLLTSHCSYAAPEITSLSPKERERISVVSSSGGFPPYLDMREREPSEIRVGYIGSLNFAKLHPKFVSFMRGVQVPEFRVRMIGDTANRDILERQCAVVGRSGLLEFRGYVTDVSSELTTLDVLAYLLNPSHYGTTENALIEAMSMGVVPIVLDNPAELQIVQDRVNGLVVSTPEEFAAALQWLERNPEQRRILSKCAVTSIRERFSVAAMEEGLNQHYAEILQLKRNSISFTRIFGDEPADWFLSCQRCPEMFNDSGVDLSGPEDYSQYALFEKSKGTVFHFEAYFPDDPRLKLWVQCLEQSGGERV